jgi:hypothetical protein
MVDPLVFSGEKILQKQFQTEPYYIIQPSQTIMLKTPFM